MFQFLDRENMHYQELYSSSRLSCGDLPSLGVVRSSAQAAAAEVHRAIAEAAFVQEFELQTDAARQRPFAAADHDRHHEQLALIDQPRRQRPAGQVAS
jgi:hypothetical protein